MVEEVRLNLGCYNKKLPGFVNIDIREDVKPDLVDDVFTLQTIQERSVDLIYASHVLEHSKSALCALKVWWGKLKDGGKLRLAVPDIQKACGLVMLGVSKHKIKSMFWGSGKHDYDFHYNGWTKEWLTNDLNVVGFKEVYEWHWQHTPPHNYCDDYSQCYFPDMAKEYYMANGSHLDMGGVLMSLNLEAVK